jgi:hypothetical protein
MVSMRAAVGSLNRPLTGHLTGGLAVSGNLGACRPGRYKEEMDVDRTPPDRGSADLGG